MPFWVLQCLLGGSHVSRRVSVSNLVPVRSRDIADSSCRRTQNRPSSAVLSTRSARPSAECSAAVIYMPVGAGKQRSEFELLTINDERVFPVGDPHIERLDQQRSIVARPDEAIRGVQAERERIAGDNHTALAPRV